jgi:hypothetical protein
MASIPDFPLAYQREGREGHVTVACDIEVDGRPTNCVLRHVDGGDAFGTAVMAWFASGTVRYKPAMSNGHPVRVSGHITNLTFKLGPPSQPPLAPTPAHVDSDARQNPSKWAIMPGVPDDDARLFRQGRVTVADNSETGGSPTNGRFRPLEAGDAFGTSVLASLGTGNVNIKPASPDGTPVGAPVHTSRFTFKLGT